MNATHTPVMIEEALEFLDARPGRVYCDATLGGGGHAEVILERTAPDGRVIGLDADCAYLRETDERLRRLFGDRIETHCTFYDQMRDVVEDRVDGVLFDLGISSWHFEESRRGFSFLREEVLDMRLNPDTGPSAADVLNSADVEDLERILRVYGGERYAGRIAMAIVRARPIHTSTRLADIVVGAVPRRENLRHRIHPATRTFQALRISVNDELRRLERAIPQAIDLLKDGGRCVVISFHSLEDGIVKRAFRRFCREGYGTILNKKPMRVSQREVQQNPRSRSARLRAFELQS